jgi:hypothetical protein
MSYPFHRPSFDFSITYTSLVLFGKFICNTLYLLRRMNSKLFLVALAVVAAFGILAAATASPLTIATPAVAQNMTGGNATGGNATAANATAGGWTK